MSSYQKEIFTIAESNILGFSTSTLETSEVKWTEKISDQFQEVQYQNKQEYIIK